MTLPGIVCTLAGLCTLAVVLWDIFVTVLHHWGGRSPVGGRLAHGLWRMGVGLLRFIPTRRRRAWLGFVGPALIPATLVLWASLTVAGFALLYLPQMPQGFHAGPGIPVPGTFFDALYVSGISFFTIGFGDVLPVARLTRFLAVLEGGAGFGLVSLSVSYFASVYTAYSAQKALAETLYAQAGESADAARVIASHLHGGASHGILAFELARLRDGMAAIGSGYANWPILHYFVSALPRESLLRLLFVVHDMVTLLDTAVDPDENPTVAGLGRRSGLEATARNLRRSLAATLLLGWDVAEREARLELEEGDPFRWAGRFRDAVDVLRGAGVAVCDGPDAVERYVRERGEWEPWVRASAVVLGEPWGEVSGGC
ncbi:MAG: Ion transport 2 domain protein [Gemmatimonadetes bacterium]|nr:Ion transport 2 domain protein [Gemmatimonadota bacterium]